MRTTLHRTISFHSPETGWIAQRISKEYNGVPPIVGAIFDDSAWGRHEVVTIEEIHIDSNTPDSYWVELIPKEVGCAEEVQQYADMTKLHGWTT